nr:hypothetical protein [uncultured Draconibacterium sp.]
MKDADLGLTVQPYNSNTTLQGVVTLASLGFTGDTDANNYIHPATHSISEVSGLQTTLDSKVDNSQVLTNVPNDAVFTDTVYDDTAIQAAVALNTAKVGISIEQAQAIEANTAKNSYPSADAAKLSGIEEGATADQTKADIDALGIDAVTVNGYTVDSNVPSGAVFTDTVYNDTAIQAEVDLNTAKLSATGNELEATDINTLAKVNTIITDAILIDTNDSRLTDTRTPIDNSVTPAKLSSHFTDIETVSVTALDWSNLGGTKTLSTDTTFTFSNLRAGVYFLITTGDYSPTFPTGFTYVGGTRAATGTTYYQIVCVDSTTPEGVYTILKNES